MLILLSAGLRVMEYADESSALRTLVADRKRKLPVAGLGRLLGGVPGPDGLNLGGLRELLNWAGELVRNGTVQYARLTFAKGRPRFPMSALVGQKVIGPVGSSCDPSIACCEADERGRGETNPRSGNTWSRK